MPPAKLAKDRLADLMAMAAKIGLVKRDKKGKKILTVPLLPTVELFDQYEPNVEPPARPQSIYRLSSGYAHAKQWAMALGVQPVAPYDSSDRSLGLAQGVDEIAIGMTRRTVDATERAMTAYEAVRL